MQVDPRTPVLVGVGQFTERLDDPDYQGISAVELATRAAQAALADTGASTADVAAAIEVFVGLRQFEICTPFADPPLGASDNYLRSVARRIGADPARAVLEPIGGNGPQKVMTEFAGPSPPATSRWR
jgi:acetyl-CoA C-acetyltransferase